jgi:hypothetical protein
MKELKKKNLLSSNKKEEKKTSIKQLNDMHALSPQVLIERKKRREY